MDLDRFAAHLAGNYVPNTVIVDCTASDAPSEHYLEWMRAGIHIITVCILIPAAACACVCVCVCACVCVCERERERAPAAAFCSS